MKMPIIGYIRVSSEGQAKEGISLEAQKPNFLFEQTAQPMIKAVFNVKDSVNP